MDNNKEILLTQEGYDKIVEELEYLKAVRRAEVAERNQGCHIFWGYFRECEL